MALKDLNWKLGLTFGGIVLLFLIVFVVLPPPYSGVLFLLLAVLSIGLGIWNRLNPTFMPRLPTIDFAVLNRPASMPAESRPHPVPAAQPHAAAVEETPEASAAADTPALRRVSRFEFFGLYVDINAPTLLDPASEAATRFWARLQPRLAFAPFVVAMVILVLLLRSVILGMLFQTENHFIYTVDDTYIQMSIAKNLAQHGVWGLTQYGFSSTSSSPAWTILLAIIYRIFGAQELVPLIINLASTVAIFGFLCYALQSRGVARIYVLLLLLGMTWFTPFISTMLTGMEHTTHTLLYLLLLHFLLDVFARPKLTPSLVGITAVLGALAVGVRYESLILLLPACCLLLVRGRVRAGLIIAAAGVLPPILYGLYSTGQGWEFVPNSLLLKTTHVEFDTFQKIIDLIHETIRSLGQRPELMVLFLVLSFAFMVRAVNRRHFWQDRPSIGLLLVTFTVFAHRAIIPNAPFLRYDTYLWVMGLFVLVMGLYDIPPRAIFRFRFDRLGSYLAIGIFITICVFVGYINSTERDINLVWGASGDIYWQQYHMGQFVHKYYNDETIALNDIGAVSYLSNARVIDLWGLATNEVALAKLNGTFTPEFIDSFTREQGVKYAIVYESWFPNMLPPSWTKVAVWFTGNAGILGGEWVTFFAVDAKDAPAMAANMEEFIPTLAPGTIPTMLYEPPPPAEAVQ